MRFPRLAPFALLLLGAAPLGATALTHVASRATQTLNGQWRVIVDPYENGYYNYRLDPFDATEPATGGYFLDRRAPEKSELVEYNFDTADTLHVPGDWNSQKPELYYYEGTVWYRTRFDAVPPAAGKRVFLHFGGANYEAHVYLNGRKLGVHVGGFTPFWFDVSDRLHAGENSLVVKVDNRRHADAVPTVNTDWWNYGGLTRDVQLVTVPTTYIADYRVALLNPTGPARVQVQVQLAGPDRAQTVTVRLPELAGATATCTTDATGAGTVELTVPGLQRWTPAAPTRYTLEVAATTDTVREQLGFRTIATAGPDILLNGQSVFLRGISLHEENPLRGGRACTIEDARLLLGWAKELGCNFVRLAHYPHNEFMPRVAEELGLMLWEEVPVYWTIHWDDPATLANARNQLRELIERDRNRASVIVWSVANETPVSEPRTAFLRTLIADARALDGTRLVSAAMERHSEPGRPNVSIVNDPLAAYTDLASFNEYVGWYEGLPAHCDDMTFAIAYDKPVIISEFGAGALQGFHADALTRFSEEFQADVYARTLPMLDKIPQLRGMTPWILVDFHSPRRPLADIQDGFNRKGLISDRGIKKAAFRILQDYYHRKGAAAPLAPAGAP